MVFVARLVCSDPTCAEEAAAEASTLRELEALACECGCALEVIGWPDTVGREATVLRLRPRGGSHGGASGREAA